MSTEQYGPWALIAGGSEGVGAAFARKLAAGGINLVLLARKREPLEEITQEIRSTSRAQVRAECLDLTSSDAMHRIEAITQDIEVGLVIYNAGAESALRDFLDRDLATSERMAALNVLGPMRLAHYFGSMMRERRRGGIILFGAIGGYAGGPGMAMYSATKAFDIVFAEALWYELRPYNVHVLGLVLGATNTPALKRIGMKTDTPGFEAADADAVAQEGLDHLPAGPIWHAAGTAPAAQYLRTMDRADAVTMIAESAKAMLQ
jgi:short-subunit dehydrogenase